MVPCRCDHTTPTAHMVWHTSPGHRVEEMPFWLLWVALRVPTPGTIRGTFHLSTRKGHGLVQTPWARRLTVVSRTRGRVMTTQKAYRKAGLLTKAGAHPNLGVAPQEWPQEIAPAWAVRSPPTPYEVGAVLTQPGGRPRPPQALDRAEWECSMGTALRWLTGHPPEGTVDELRALQVVIEAIREDPRTLPWALGADMRVLPLRWHQMSARQRLEHPYLRGLRLRGGARTPIRPLPPEGARFLWATREAKARSVARYEDLKWPWFRYQAAAK